ncbi:MAG: hypothetical protein IJL12_06870 [Selenomonadaceae bacterium]|nr:hypothetical protein [Selenomonadaceae bacterium]
MSDEERTKRKVSFDQIPLRQRTSLEAQLPKVSTAKGCGCLLILLIALLIALNAIFGDDDKPPEQPAPIPTQQPALPPAETKKPAQNLGEHWIKDANGVYLWNPKPTPGETITWSGDFVQDGDYRYADGAGITTWYLNGEIEQVDEGTFRHGQRHGKFTHKFPGGRVSHSNWDNGIEIPEQQPALPNNTTSARQTFLDYHKAISDKNYRAAYEMLSYKQRERVGNFDSYVAGFVNTISSDVSELNLVSSDEDSCTFDYTIIARDRYPGGKIKVQTFRGQVTLAKDNGRWFIRLAKSNKVNESIE